MKDHRIVRVGRRMGYCNGFDVAPVGRSGGLILWWDDSVQVNMRDSSKHFIDATCCIVQLQCEL